MRSENGFVTSLIVPEGNAADSGQLVPSVRNSIIRTGVTPVMVGTDDGYASRVGVDALKEMGVEHVSISGSKGRRLTDEADWESELYREARRKRSAVESLVFTLKHGFEFGVLGRRGIENVRVEWFEKTLEYNFVRIILVRSRKKRLAAMAA